LTTAGEPAVRREVVCLHGLGRSPDPALEIVDAAVPPGAILIGHSIGGVRALRLARERPHRFAYVRSLRGRSGAPVESTSRSAGLSALAGLARLGLHRAAFDADADAVAPPVLVVHARDHHHVPIDLALAAVARHPCWEMRTLDRGGHHAQVTEPGPWLAAVSPWLEAGMGGPG
jgi:pimeloyl-ACP methyl ester carboxylesterase